MPESTAIMPQPKLGLDDTGLLCKNNVYPIFLTINEMYNRDFRFISSHRYTHIGTAPPVQHRLKERAPVPNSGESTPM